MAQAFGGIFQDLTKAFIERWPARRYENWLADYAKNKHLPRIACGRSCTTAIREDSSFDVSIQLQVQHT